MIEGYKMYEQSQDQIPPLYCGLEKAKTPSATLKGTLNLKLESTQPCSEQKKRFFHLLLKNAINTLVIDRCSPCRN